MKYYNMGGSLKTTISSYMHDKEIEEYDLLTSVATSEKDWHTGHTELSDEETSLIKNLVDAGIDMPTDAKIKDVKKYFINHY